LFVKNVSRAEFLAISVEPNEANTPQPTRPPTWAKLALGVGFVLTALWNGVILWGITELLKVTR
jgi:hypothetical protein